MTALDLGISKHVIKQVYMYICHANSQALSPCSKQRKPNVDPHSGSTRVDEAGTSLISATYCTYSAMCRRSLAHAKMA